MKLVLIVDDETRQRPPEKELCDFCYSCQQLKEGCCKGEKNKVYTGCVYHVDEGSTIPEYKKRPEGRKEHI